MTPDSRDWHVRMADRWQGRAAELRADPGRCAQMRAAVLDSIVADLRARLAAAPLPAAAPIAPIVPAGEPKDADFWRKHLAGCQPYRCPKTGVMFNNCDLSARLRAKLEARIAGLPDPVFSDAIAPPAPPPIRIEPPPEPIPFRAGPQLDMFA